MRQEIRLAGFGGQGIISLGIIIASAIGKFEGKFVAQTQSYGPEARGGACKTEVVFSDTEIDYIKALKPDVLLVMSQPALDKYVVDLDPDKALVLFDSTLVQKGPERIKHAIGLPATKIAEEKFKTQITANIIMLGALVKVSGMLNYDACCKALKANLPVKAVVQSLAAFEAGYRYAESMQGDKR